MANGDDKYKGVTIDSLHRDPKFGKLSPEAQKLVINEVLDANRAGSVPTDKDRQVMSGPLRFVSGFGESFGLEPTIKGQIDSTKGFYKALWQDPLGTLRNTGSAALETGKGVSKDILETVTGQKGIKGAQKFVEDYRAGHPLKGVGEAIEEITPLGFGRGAGTMARGDIARGGGQLAGSAVQLASMGSSEPTAAPVERTGRVMIRGKEYPALRGEVAAEPGALGSIEKGMKSSLVGGPLRKVAAKQQSFAQNLISTIATDKAGIAPKPEDFIGNVERAGEAIRKDASKEYDAIAEHLAKGAPVPGQTEIGPAAKTAATREEAMRNYQLVEQSAKKAYEKPFHQLTPDEQHGLLDTFGLEEGDIKNPRIKASSMTAQPSTSRGAALQFKNLQAERHAISEQRFSAIRKQDWTAVRELKNQLDQTESGIDALMKAQKQPELYNRYLQAKARTAQAYAIKEVGATLDSVTKGLTKAQQEGAGFKPSAQEIGGPQLVEKLKDLDRQLPRAFGQQDAAAIRQTAEMLRRGQEKGGMMSSFARQATSFGPAAYAVEEIFRGKGTQGLEYAVGMYGGLWIASKVLASRSGRIAMLNFIKSVPGSIGEGLWRSRVLAVAGAGSNVADQVSRKPPSPQPAGQGIGQTPTPQSSQ